MMMLMMLMMMVTVPHLLLLDLHGLLLFHHLLFLEDLLLLLLELLLLSALLSVKFILSRLLSPCLHFLFIIHTLLSHALLGNELICKHGWMLSSSNLMFINDPLIGFLPPLGKQFTTFKQGTEVKDYPQNIHFCRKTE